VLGLLVALGVLVSFDVRVASTAFGVLVAFGVPVAFGVRGSYAECAARSAHGLLLLLRSSPRKIWVARTRQAPACAANGDR
jgi:hypothetical protein